MTSGNLPGDTTAASQVVAFTVAGLVFIGAVGAALFAAGGAVASDRGATAAAEGSRAERLADLLVGSSGVGMRAGSDSFDRLGLRADNGSGLQQSTLDALRGATFVSKADGKLDYPETATSLGLDSSEQFHIRVYPVAMPALYQESLADVRTAFIGDWVSLTSVSVPLTADELATASPVNGQLPVATQNGLMEKVQIRVDATMFSLTANERNALDALGLDYDDDVYISTLAPTILLDQPFPLADVPLYSKVNLQLFDGDVYPDVKDYLRLNLPQRLALYEVLIVGSGVDQSTMTSNEVKSAIKDWVLDGGTLIVLGTDKANYQWLQPIFDVGIKTANGVPVAPDVSHPLLKDPSSLDWTHYDAHGFGWNLKTSAWDHFNHVIVDGDLDLFTVSKDGAYGSGRVLLTSYLVREIAAELGAAEAENFLENVILYSDRAHLYLDYGPTLPADTPVSVAVRQSFLWDSKLGQVPVRIEVHAWEG